MPETLALFRLTLARNRLVLVVLVTAVAGGVATAWQVGTIDPGSGSFAILALLLTMLPAGVAVIGLFDYGQEGDMNLPESGCSHWLLRMPVESWKIAMVPVLLRTLWISLLWMLFAVLSRHLGATTPIPLLAPCIGLSAIAIWVLVIAWRPFRSGWRRLGALAVAAPILYGMMVALFVAPHIHQVHWRPTAIVASITVAIVVYAAAVATAIQSVRLARVCSLGVIPESVDGRGWSLFAESDDRVAINYRSPRHALAARQWARSRGWVRRVIVVGAIPTVVVFVLLVPLSAVSATAALLAFAYLAVIAISRTSAPIEGSAVLPPQVASSPLSDASIAWTTSLVPLLIAGGVFSMVLCVLVGWGCWPENRQAWLQWAASIDGSSTPLITALRWSTAIVLASAVFLLSRLAAWMWIGMTGRVWLGAVASILGGLMVLVPIGIVIRWFIQQTDWESTRASALSYLAVVPYLMAGWLACKGLFASGCLYFLKRREVYPGPDMLRVLLIWAATTLSFSAAMTALIPDRRASFLWCLAVTMAVIPLGRILILPAALGWNRHR